jgi:hypothetical protein
MGISSEWEVTLKYFTWKVEKNVSDTAYEALRDLLSQSGVNIHGIKATRKYLQRCLEIPIHRNDCCVNSHMAFNGSERHRRNCIICGTSRFWNDTAKIGDLYFPNQKAYANLKSRATYPYIPLIPRLKVLAADANTAREMAYPLRLRKEPWKDGIRDIWDAEMMKKWVSEGYFEDERTVALHFSGDGVQTFKSGTKAKDSVWPFLILILNLPPTERYLLDL